MGSLHLSNKWNSPKAILCARLGFCSVRPRCLLPLILLNHWRNIFLSLVYVQSSRQGVKLVIWETHWTEATQYFFVSPPLGTLRPLGFLIASLVACGSVLIVRGLKKRTSRTQRAGGINWWLVFLVYSRQPWDWHFTLLPAVPWTVRLAS